MVKSVNVNEVTGDATGLITHAKFKNYYKVITDE